MLELETFHTSGFSQPAHGPVQHQPDHGQCADGAQHQRSHAAMAGRARHGVCGVRTELLQLQAVVANEERQGLHVADRLAHLDVQLQPTLRSQQRGTGRHERNPAAAAEARLVGLAVLQQLGVDAQAGVDQKQAVVDGGHLHRQRTRVEQHQRCSNRIGGDAVRPCKVVEGAVRNDAHGATG